jgi:hypothetical protein
LSESGRCREAGEAAGMSDSDGWRCRHCGRAIRLAGAEWLHVDTDQAWCRRKGHIDVREYAQPRGGGGRD